MENEVIHMTYTVSQAAEKAGLSVYTLRYYDKEGLMPFLDKAPDGTRRFKDSDFQWLKTIRRVLNRKWRRCSSIRRPSAVKSGITKMPSPQAQKTGSPRRRHRIAKASKA